MLNVIPLPRYGSLAWRSINPIEMLISTQARDFLFGTRRKEFPLNDCPWVKVLSNFGTIICFRIGPPPKNPFSVGFFLSIHSFVI